MSYVDILELPRESTKHQYPLRLIGVMLIFLELPKESTKQQYPSNLIELELC